MADSYSLYKYYAPMEYNFDALEQGYWFFKKFGHANDPFDCDMKLLDIINNKWNLKSDYIKKSSVNDFAICSFSDSPLNKHLWALYSDCYKGFVVEFKYDEKDYAEFVAKGLALPLFDVSYLDKKEIETIQVIPTLQLLIPPVQENMPQERARQQEREDLFYFLYSIKEKAIWSAEHEKRILLGNVKPTSNIPNFFIEEQCYNGYKVFFPNHLIKRIIIGASVSDGNLRRLSGIAEKYQVEIEQIVKGAPFELRLNKLAK